MKRYGEVDNLRGIAIVMMVVFHFFWDLDFLGILENTMYEGGWLVFQRITISLFILLVGISLYISYSKMKDNDTMAIVKKYGRRSLTLFAIALLISLATWLAVPDGFVVFGIIHFIALSILIALLFLRFYYLNFLLGVLLLAQGMWLPLEDVNTPWLLWLGFTYPGFYSVDYVPLIPWFGLVLIGLFLGKTFYRKRTPVRQRDLLPWLSWLGRHSLIIYLIHQPILLGLLTAYRLLLPIYF